MEKPDQTLTGKLAALAHSNSVIPVLLILEILETTFVPFPYEAAFIAICLAARERIWLFVAITVAGSAIAGSILYGLGAGLAEPLADYLGVEAAVGSYQTTFQERGGILIFLGGLTPVPSYLVNLVAGASGYPYLSFVALFSASRFVRFAVIGLLLYFFGETISNIWAKIPVRLQTILVVAFLLAVTLWSVFAML